MTSDEARERGGKGGRATFARHGREHMAALGRAGFAAAARKVGGRKAMLGRLAGRGRITLPGASSPAAIQRAADEAWAYLAEHNPGDCDLPF